VRLEPDDFAAAAKSLAERLRTVKAISELTSGEHDEPETLSNSLLSIAAACESFVQETPSLLDPELRGDALTERISSLLVDLHNILHGVESSKYLRRMFSPLREEWRSRP
jgi:hypothetical protein